MTETGYCTQPTQRAAPKDGQMHAANWAKVVKSKVYVAVSVAVLVLMVVNALLLYRASHLAAQTEDALRTSELGMADCLSRLWHDTGWVDWHEYHRGVGSQQLLSARLLASIQVLTAEGSCPLTPQQWDRLRRMSVAAQADISAMLALDADLQRRSARVLKVFTAQQQQFLSEQRDKLNDKAWEIYVAALRERTTLMSFLKEYLLDRATPNTSASTAAWPLSTHGNAAVASGMRSR